MFEGPNKNIGYTTSNIPSIRLVYFLLIFNLDQKTHWSSIYNILKNFLNIWPVMIIAMRISDTKIFKKNNIYLTNYEIGYLEKVLKILEIFVKATTKLQAEVYPTVYYMVPEIYAIYSRLDQIKEELYVSFQNLILG
jgi:hypothetical protein